MIVGIGTDITKVARFERSLHRFGDRFAQRILSEDEYRQFANHARARFLAKRFAVKEAAVKALGTGFGEGVYLRDISLDHTEWGAPVLVFSDRVKQLLVRKGVTGSHVSLSDEDEYAIAFVVLSGSG